MREVDDVIAWAEENQNPQTTRLLIAAFNLKKQPDPDALPAGSAAKLAAQGRQQTFMTMARGLGYQPPVKELASEVLKEVIKSQALGLVPVSDAVREAADNIPVPEKCAGKKEKKKGKDNGLGLGMGF